MKHINPFQRYNYEAKYDRLKIDIYDILLELSDNNINLVNSHIAESIFEIYISISNFKNKTQKNITEDVIFRLNDFLKENGLKFISAVLRITGKSTVVDNLSDINLINRQGNSIFLVFGERGK